MRKTIPVEPTSDRGLDASDKLSRARSGLVLTISALVGLTGSVLLAVETYLRDHNPDYHLKCSINPLVSCQGAMDSAAGNLLGFSNAYVGVVLYATLVVLAVAIWRGVGLPTWIYWGLTGAGVGAAAMVAFFVFTSVVQLRTLCPYCMVVWAGSILLCVYALALALQERFVFVGEGMRTFFVKNRTIVLVGLYAAVVATVVIGLADKWQYVF